MIFALLIPFRSTATLVPAVVKIVDRNSTSRKIFTICTRRAYVRVWLCSCISRTTHVSCKRTWKGALYAWALQIYRYKCIHTPYAWQIYSAKSKNDSSRANRIGATALKGYLRYYYYYRCRCCCLIILLFWYRVRYTVQAMPEYRNPRVQKIACEASHTEKKIT